MRAARPRIAAAAGAAACALLALAGCGSPPAADTAGTDGAAEDTRAAQPGLTVIQAAALAAQPDEATQALLRPLVAPAPRDFDPKLDGGVHTLRMRQERWSGGLRTQTMAAVVDWAGSGRVELALDNTGGGMADPDGEDVQNMRIRVIGHTVYGMVGAKPAEGSGGRHWVKLEGEAAASFTGVSAAALDPLKDVQSMLMLPTTEPVGSGTFHGVKARHYRSVLNQASLDKIAQQPFGKASAEQLKAALESAGITSEVIDLWLSPDRRPLEVTVEQESAYGSTKEVTDYLDYGLAVDVQAPPAFDTVSSEELDAANG